MMNQVSPSEQSFPSAKSPKQARWIGEEASHRIQHFERCTQLKTSETIKSIKQLDWENLNVGRLIGQGKFSSVYMVSMKEDDKPSNDRVYALKALNRRCESNERLFLDGAIDLIVEAKILSSLDHPNIIKLHAVKGGDPCESYSFDGGHFLVLDLLSYTLDSLLESLRPKRLGASWRMSLKKDMLGRLENVALGIARGMAYLHAQNIIFRDLKQANIGFDQGGTVRIFDFGLAREYRPSIPSENGSTDGVRLLTCHCGTPRYMAPEVAASHDYGFGCDVYSFAILLWEICTLNEAYDDIDDIEVFHEQVVKRNKRPSLKKISSSTLRALLESSWDKDATVRPSFPSIVKALELEITAIEFKSSGPSYTRRFFRRQ